MKKLLCILVALCLCAPAACGMADAPPASEAHEFVTLPADSAQSEAAYLARIAHMDAMLRRLALSTYHGGAGWDSPEAIAEPWAAVYSYICAHELSGDWARTADGYALIPAAYVRSLFTDMYGAQCDALPQVSRMYSSLIRYDEASDCYAVAQAYGGIVESALLRAVELNEGGASVTYTIVGAYDKLNADLLANVTITLESGAPSTYGFRPARAELIPVEK